MKHRRLRHLRVASPCPAAWSDMVGDDKVRFCQACSLNVYNVSAMTADEAEELLSKANGRLCVRYYRRADGRVLTQDCPVGLARVRQRVAGRLTAVAAVLAGVLLFPWRATEAELGEATPTPVLRPQPAIDPADYVMGDMAGPAVEEVRGRAVMGKVRPLSRDPKVMNHRASSDVE